MSTSTFSFTGAVQPFTVPAGVTSVTAECHGAQGGAAFNNVWPGGRGGYAKATFPVTPGETLNVYVGGAGVQAGSSAAEGGFNGGGSGYAGGSGGGASDVRRGTALTDRLLVGGGGGGGGSQSAGGAGGAGGGTSGADGQPGLTVDGAQGRGGTQTAGGARGTGFSNNGTAGTFGLGGGRSSVNADAVAGGGGGWYGGGAGNVGSDGAGGSDLGGGGGGSGYITGTLTSLIPDQRTGNGLVVLTYNQPPSEPGAFTSPAPGATVAGPTTIAWGASTDPDGDALAYAVDLSTNGGGSWTQIRAFASGVSFTHDFTGLPAGASALLRVRASDGALTSGYTTSGTFTINAAPTAPLLGFPSNGQVVDRNSTVRLSWTHSDPNPGDQQSKYDLRYRLTGAPSWTTVTGSTTNQFRDFAPSSLPTGNYEWQVRTYDSLVTVGPYSSSGFFTADDAPPGPIFTAPVNGGTVDANPFTVTWSSSDQAAYQLRTVADAAGSPDTATVYTDTGVVESATARARDVAFPTNLRPEHVQLRVRDAGGLWSGWASNAVMVSYSPPAVPVLTLDEDRALAALVLTFEHPLPTGAQPVVTGVDVFRRVGGDVGDGLRVARLSQVLTGWTDWTPASGVDYEYRVTAYGANGTTAEGPWQGLAAGDYELSLYDQSVYA